MICWLDEVHYVFWWNLEVRSWRGVIDRGKFSLTSWDSLTSISTCSKVLHLFANKIWRGNLSWWWPIDQSFFSLHMTHETEFIYLQVEVKVQKSYNYFLARLGTLQTFWLKIRLRMLHMLWTNSTHSQSFKVKTNQATARIVSIVHWRKKNEIRLFCSSTFQIYFNKARRSIKARIRQA